MLLTHPFHQEGDSIRDAQAQRVPTNQPCFPSAQEELLAELLAEQPANRRAELIARALANSRQIAEATAEKTTLVNDTGSVESALQSLRSQQQAVVKELADLRREGVNWWRAQLEKGIIRRGDARPNAAVETP